MNFFLHELLFSILGITLFWVCGYGVLCFCLDNQNLTHQQKFFLAPMNGVIVSVVGIILYYSFGINFSAAVLLAAIPLGLLSCYYLKENYEHLNLPIILTYCAMLFLMHLFCNSNALKENGPSLQMTDGSDAMGYSMSADWLRLHTITCPPSISPSHPAEVLPYQNLRTDQRLGSFCFLALISKLVHRTGFFSYNLSLAIALTIFVIGLAAVVSSVWVAFLLTITALVCSSLIDLGNAGYLGKVLGYPSLIYLLIIICKNKNYNTKNILYYVVIAAGSSCLYSYIHVFTVFGFAALIVGVYVLFLEQRKINFQLLIDPKKNALFYLLITFAVIGFSFSGGFLVLLVGGPNWNRGLLQGYTLKIKCSELLFLIANVDYSPSLISFSWGVILAILTGIGFLFMVFASIWFKNKTSFVLMCLPFSIMIITLLSQRYWGAYQMSLLMYLCAALSLSVLITQFLKRNDTLKNRCFSVLLFIIFIIPHLPRFYRVIDRFAQSAPERTRYSFEEMTTLRRLINNKKTLIDVEGVYDSQPLLIELEGNDENVFFSARAWIIEGWGLPYSEYAAAHRGDDYELKIFPASEQCEPSWMPIYKGRHYQLAQRTQHDS